ncbi:uncharacterized protein LACBIDRAFT_329753 [Laccaria bicolor S238N-H82]|uniref:Predicted protein n=1 Tax=Laccaria bicolor (strain S238N-H82 / ATCC MYA-4686) TaxID=486041 RepID=B0DJ43_LACBS|nr:uncharacterized protein LACBIDRAFT_329753 [Laccaria bicolor S238N-H82]EDR05456.1 predicted protein [Laccaria bicolor S238N-H82]|eukprot:XP_001884014.1 predicted protein [Laccaria bicolor S238N-H82]
MADQMSPTAKKSKKKSRGIRKFIPDLKSPNESAHQSNSTRVSVSSASSAHHGTDAGNAEPRASNLADSLILQVTPRPLPSRQDLRQVLQICRSPLWVKSRRTLNLIPSEGAHDPPRLDLTKVPAAGASSAERPDKGDRRGNASVWREISRNGRHALPRQRTGWATSISVAMVQTPKTRKDCVPVGPEPIPAGVCTGNPDQTYKGPPGWRKIPGNTCVDGVKKDEKVDKKCSQGFLHNLLPGKSPTKFMTSNIRSCNTRTSRTPKSKPFWFVPSTTPCGNPATKVTAGCKSTLNTASLHSTTTNTRTIAPTSSPTPTPSTQPTTDEPKAPTPPDTFGAQVTHFHPNTDNLIWTGNRGCSAQAQSCHAEAQYSRDNGRKWSLIDSYVWNRAWAKDAELNTDPNEIICGTRRATSVFDHVVGFAKFSEFLVVAEMIPERRSWELEVSLDGIHFATGKFPPSVHPETHAYTVLESSTKSLFLHMTMSEAPAPFWGDILKSNSNGTHFGLALENVNQDEQGYVDLEKMIGLDGIALANVVSNPADATLSGHKQLQSRITHNDGSTWRPLTPPLVDSQGNIYSCEGTCALHIHGYTEQMDPRATYSSPSIVGVLMAVGNVANDEEPTDHILFSTDEGLTWREYKFTEKMRVRSIVAVPSDTSRRFILFGSFMRTPGSIAVHIDFTQLTSRKCSRIWFYSFISYANFCSLGDLSADNPEKDDFEMWSPSENRPQQCLFGRQTLGYRRRIRNTDCTVGEQEKAASRVVLNWVCSKIDFECEFNHVKNANDESELVPGTTPLPDSDAVCRNGEEFWYERTAYRLTPYFSCTDGERPDRGREHRCPGFKFHSARFWLFMLLLPFGFTALNAFYYYRRSGLARGTIRLPGDGGRPAYGGDIGVVATLASVPWSIVGVAGIAWEWVVSHVERLAPCARSGYRNLPIDKDA